MSSEKSANYRLLLEQARGLLEHESDLIANMANLSALLFNGLPDLNWAGFYIMREGELVLGPFQGQVACVRIAVGKGVCGTCVATGAIQRVADVHEFPGHIACDAASNSEIVLPVRHNGIVIAVLDIDSPLLNRFDDIDEDYLGQLVDIFEQRLAQV
ncbi:GAF domain-containing protein [Alishewanella sp. 16-MA]|uniref:GAF domain-containing protein n=1 Tax=Alishewanella maricola TaxID=2795740 RepID=A0ABS8C5L2_9ALTE|nr:MULTISPECIES: GAF domain-containing protein [Alishewanella]MDP4945442.1 GAF domain-containing protein [Alishewanella sp.]MCB5227620.1 GAF domain-containing protein [Alishewanella maricola]MDP5035918.1 GAF domain-containing protein [Alishewanella sp.]MDP5185685.1 GAF domain-containing protein [Alishewanella sp.]MDP5460757.1 GAF domain-containing protein [Alishewanella sp. SMS8]